MSTSRSAMTRPLVKRWGGSTIFRRGAVALLTLVAVVPLAHVLSPGAAAQSVGADLVVFMSVSADGTSVKDRTRNRAASTGVGASITRFYLSADGILDAGDIPVGSRAIPPLDARTAGARASCSPPSTAPCTFEHRGETPLTLPAGLIAGTYRVIAVADADLVHGESDEANNASVSAPITFLPDLIVSSATVPRKAVAGAAIDVSDTTANRGAAQAPESSTGYYLSRDRVLDAGDALLGNRAILPLDVGASNVGTTTVVIPDTTVPGCYFIIAAADVAQAVSERGEVNAARARPIQIRPPTGTKLLCANSDFNGDRKSDILWRHADGLVVIWLMGGLHAIGGDSPGSVGTDWTIQSIGDFNGDGNADILWRDANGVVAIWLMDGVNTISTGSPGTVATDWTIQ